MKLSKNFWFNFGIGVFLVIFGIISGALTNDVALAALGVGLGTFCYCNGIAFELLELMRRPRQ